MAETFNLQKAMNWASSGSKTGKPSVSAREQTLARHNSELKFIKKIDLSDENVIKRELLNSNELENKYRNFSLEEKFSNTDLISMRVAGKYIDHGKIKFKEGIVGVNAFYFFIKNAVENVFASNNQLKKDYLDNVYMLVPEKGSFIHRAEIKLYDSGDFDSYYANRSVNVQLAKSMLNFYSCLNSINKYEISSLVLQGVNESLCKNFIDLFSNDADEINFDFTWAKVGKPIPADLQKNIIFKKKHLSKAVSYYEKFKSLDVFSLENITACIERYTWLESKDFGEISIKLKYKDIYHTCTVAVNEEQYTELKSLPPKSFVSISGDFSMKTNGKGKLYINKITKINKPQDDLFD